MQADPTSYTVLRIAGRAFVLDISRCVAFAVDEEAVEALEFVTNPAQADSPDGVAALRGGVAEAAREWQGVLAQGFLRSRFGEGVPSRPSYLRTVELSLTHRCTMRCRYCYSGHDAATRTAPLDMPEEVMEAALEWAAREFARESRHLHITAGVTGEGLLRLDAYRRLVEKARRLAAETGKQITQSLGNTNLTLAEDPEVWEMLTSPECHVWSVSFDGPPEVHNANRVLADGRGSYDRVLAASRRILESAVGPSYLAQAVITGEHPEVKEIFLHLDEIGFARIFTRPVRGRPDQPFAINAETVGAVKQGYTDFVRYLLDQDDPELLRLLLKCWDEWDFLGRFLWRLAYHQSVLYRCQAGKDLVCVDTNGDLYPCPGMVGDREVCIGSVFTGITEEARRRYYEDLLVTRKPGCQECWARHLCGGGCYHAAYLVNGRIDETDSADCELMRHLIELSVYMISCLKQDRPAVYAALPHPTQTTLNQAVVASCIAVNQPLGFGDAVDKWRTARPIRLDRVDQARGRIWGGVSDLSAQAHFHWDAEKLYVMVEITDARQQEFDAGALLEIHLAALPHTQLGDTPAIWWDTYVPHHRICCDLPSGECVVRSGNMTLGSAMEVSPEAPAVLQSEEGQRRVRMAIPWSELPLLTAAAGARLAVNVTVFAAGFGRTPSYMKWVPNQAFGVLRLEG